MALDFTAGCLGGCAGILVGYPLDTIKVHMQTQDYKNPKYRNTWHCFRTILKQESLAGLYRGMTSPIAGVAVVNAIVFGVYGQTQERLSEPDHLSTHFFAGASAGLAQSPVASPIELTKTRLQLQSQSSQIYSGPLHCLKQIFKEEGFRGVCNGLGMTLLREIPGYGVYFLTYEALTRSPTPISTWQMLMAGGLAGTASWVISYPVDVVKSRLQAARCDKYSGAFDCFRQSFKAEGYRFLYRGLSSTLLRAFPTNAATFAVVTWTFRLFDCKASEQPSVDENAQPLVKHQAKKHHETFYQKWSAVVSNASVPQLNTKMYYSTFSLMATAPEPLKIVHKFKCDEHFRSKHEVLRKNASSTRIEREDDEKFVLDLLLDI